MPEKIVNQRIQEIDGLPCLVLVGETGREFYFPAKWMQAIFDNAMQQYNAFAAQHDVAAGEWKPAMIITPQTWNTGITDTGATAITIDQGLPSEQTFALKPEYADGLGKQLIETAARAGPPPKRN